MKRWHVSINRLYGGVRKLSVAFTLDARSASPLSTARVSVLETAVFVTERELAATIDPDLVIASKFEAALNEIERLRGCGLDHKVVSRVDAKCGCPGGDKDGFDAQEVRPCENERARRGECRKDLDLPRDGWCGACVEAEEREARHCDRCDPSFGCFDGSEPCRKVEVKR